jgi:hypothetical protein
MIMHACKKEKGPEAIKLNVPFYANPGKNYILNETVVDTATGKAIQHTMIVKCTSVADYRCFISDGFNGCCPNSSGGRADVNLVLSKDQESPVSSTLFFPGCTHGDEYDTINTNAPTLLFYQYKVSLLKLDPWNSKPEIEKDYSAKLIVRKS